mgnify:CR=1 FL=1
MNRLEILKYLASNENVRKSTNNDIYLAQKEYYHNDTPNNLFNTYRCIAKNMCEITKSKGIEVIKREKFVDLRYIKKGHFLIKNGKIDEIVCLDYLIHNEELLIKNNEFDVNSYYAMFNDLIDNFTMVAADEVIEQKTLVFYITYGYFNNIVLTEINPLIFSASYMDFFKSWGIKSENNILDHYYKTYKTDKYKFIFDPIVYIASNYETMHDFVNCRGNVDEQRATKHYIRQGYTKQIPIGKFDKFVYLANNHRRIKECMKMRDSKILYDINRLTNRNVAQNYLNHKGNAKSDKFNAAVFVKTYVQDENVNIDNKLSNENAHEYFVKAYCNNQTIRYHKTYAYMLSKFLRDRAFDGSKQVPFHTIRLILTKFA